MLTRRGIITAAMELIEAEGPQALSMTRLATELGCGLIALYRHVPSTSALLDGIAVAIMSGLDDGPDVGPGWADQMRAQARAIRQAARAYPRCSVAVAGRKPAASAVLRSAEHALATLSAAGFCRADAVRIVRTVAAYVTGSLLREAGGGAWPSAGADGDDSHRPRLLAAEFPQITSLEAELARPDPEADFELGLDLLVAGMDALLASRSGG